MKKSLTLLAALFLVLGLVATANAQNDQLKDINGYAWEQSTPDAKHAYLLGVNSMVALDFKIAEAEKTKPNRFVEGYYAVLKDVDTGQISKFVDNWYTQNPDKKDNYVLSVIYFHMIRPHLTK